MATAIEYGLIAALISVGIITAATSLGDNISNKFETISTEVWRCFLSTAYGFEAPFTGIENFTASDMRPGRFFYG